MGDPMMSPLASRRIPAAALLLLALVISCGRSPVLAPPGGPASVLDGSARASEDAAPVADEAREDGSAVSLPEPPAPSVSSGNGRPCKQGEMPGSPCDAPQCWGTRCGVDFRLICKDGAWVPGKSPNVWNMVCPMSEPVPGLDQIRTGACCGQPLPRNSPQEPPSCSECPQTAPMDGEPCSLRDSCAPKLIDCFYKCCCYGFTVWAQCDGRRWRLATSCSDK